MKMLWVAYYFDMCFQDYCIEGIFSLEDDAKKAASEFKLQHPDISSGHLQLSFDKVQQWIVDHHLKVAKRFRWPWRERVKYLWGKHAFPIDATRIK